jgi:hypothetical protein
MEYVNVPPFVSAIHDQIYNGPAFTVMLQTIELPFVCEYISAAGIWGKICQFPLLMQALLWGVTLFWAGTASHVSAAWWHI